MFGTRRSKDTESIDWDDDIYAEYSMHHGATTHMRAYRTPQWKLLRDFASPGRNELYDLKNDPDERTNIFQSDDPIHVRIREELDRKILQRMRSLNDPALRAVP